MTSMDVVTGEQLRALLDDDQIPVDRRLLFSLLWEGELRLGDALSLDAADFDPEARSVVLEVPVHGRGPLVAPVGEESAALMEQVLAGRRQGPLFVNRQGRPLAREVAVRWAEAVGHGVHAFRLGGQAERIPR
ncbi:tyrosine-type recombinase/integrase [Streptomyces goshikiensis]|uniref:tyrosine-type recombinase/integrase n=1 Tax=Streptomyces goshikiensis TaxID=1942 RepID=UPI003661F237